MVLTYLRMGSATSDYAFRICSLEEIVRQAVRKYSQMFIMTRTRLHLEIQDQKILTDEKWLTFVIEQIFSNAVKYARGGEISIYTEDKTLVIADDGIGIAEEDLPRIFEKGFTGYNGRANKKSTGIGLYLCKSIIDRLHHTIWIESKPEKGTKIYLNFDREPSADRVKNSIGERFRKPSTTESNYNLLFGRDRPIENAHPFELHSRQKK